MTTNRKTVRLVKQIKAPPSKVFEALTIPKNMMQWWSVDAGHNLWAEADVRPGGRYSIAFRMVDGSEHNPTGVYKEVVPNSKLVFTWEWPDRPEWESLVTIELRSVDIGTVLTLTHENLPDEAAESHEAGWTGLLEQLDFHFGGHE